jgi:AcrR family transcriptional regulator
MADVDERASGASQAEKDPLMGRRERKKLRTRREIYDAAMRLFGASGYKDVTIEAICREADVARTTFFAHFPSKSALLHEYSREITARFLELPQPEEASITDRLRSLATLVMESWFEHADVMGAMLLEFTPQTGEHLEETAEQVPLLDLVAKLIEEGRERGEFGPGVEAMVAAAVFLSSGSIVLAATTRRTEVDPEALRDEFLNLALHGLAGRAN